MKVSQKIETQIQEIPTGITFGYQDLSILSDEYVAAAKALERLTKKGIIKKISKGVFYKPKQTVFGELKPSENELLKTYLFSNGKRIAYITGLSLYNKLGFTTQIPATILIASRDKKIFIRVGTIKATPVKSYVDVTNDNYYLLEILDVFKGFKQIPDLDIKSAIKLLSFKLQNLVADELSLLVDYALKYPPRVRAFLGSVLENIGNIMNLDKLKNSLNAISKYDFNISTNILPTSINWNIK